MGKYFGTDGIRGKAFIKLNETLAFRVGQGLAKAFDLSEVVIGHDTRQSSPMIAYMVASGALSMGLNVRFYGVCSTPMLAYYAKENSMIGIMVTASHNPYTDNGIKVFNKGYKTNSDEEKLIEEVIDHPTTIMSDFGTFKLADDFLELYEKLYDAFPDFKSTIKIAYDSANGGNYEIAKSIFEKYTKSAIQIGNKPDGLNINVDCGSTHMDHIQDYIIENNFDLGISFDGDGDRLLVCDKETIYEGDEIIYVIAKFLRQNLLLKDHHIVLTKMSNPGLLKALRDDDITYSLTDVGDKYVTKELHENNYSIGGENSGHIIINQILHTGDGLLAAIYLLYVLDSYKKTLKELLNYEKYPYQLYNLKDVDKTILDLAETKVFLKKMKHKLGDDALLLVRPSGTEPLIRITVSHQNQHVVDNTINEIVQFMKQRRS